MLFGLVHIDTGDFLPAIRSLERKAGYLLPAIRS